MASILNTDLGDLYSQWGERVAFNEGYQNAKIVSARSAGASAFNDGLDSSSARDAYFASLEQKRAEAQEFLSSENVVTENVDVDDIGDVLDGEDSLGLESVVACENEDIVISDEDFWTFANDPEFVEDPVGYMRSIG